MKYISLLIFLFTISDFTTAQDTVSHSYPNGIYATLDDFITMQPDTTSKLRKLNLGVHTDYAFADTVVDHVLFLNKGNDIIKKIFAVVHKGEIYFQEYGIKKHMHPDYYHKSITASTTLHRVKERGKYFYSEANYKADDAAATLVGAAMFGVVGAVVASSLTPSGEFLAPFVFDTKKNLFFVFVTRPHLKLFMDSYYPGNSFDIDRGKLEIDTVRNLFIELNGLPE
ncbi:MAG TPA: hypothetical protein VMZ69_00045 [Saprospiraceae bacterium]|nr:hypothetical protein [Saprospiraceae bacterium]